MYIDIILYYMFVSLIVGMYCSIKIYAYIIYNKTFPNNKFKTIIWTIIGGVLGSLIWPLTLMYLSNKWKYGEPFNPFRIEKKDEDDFLFWG